MRTAGTAEGLYRYAEDGDDDDALCQKLTGIFEISSKASSVPIEVTIGGNTIATNFPISSTKHGSFRKWIDMPEISTQGNTPRDNALHVTVTSLLDDKVVIPVHVTPPSRYVMARWLSHLTDELASEVLALTRRVDEHTPSIRELYCVLTLKKIESISAKIDSSGEAKEEGGDGGGCMEEKTQLLERLECIEQQVVGLRAGKDVNQGKLSDLRFGSYFSGQQKKPKQSPVPVTTFSTAQLPVVEQLVFANEPLTEQPLKRYLRNIDELVGRTPLQHGIMQLQVDSCSQQVLQLIDTCTVEDVSSKDTDGNNALMLAAYCGHSEVIRAILAKHPVCVADIIEASNPEGETAATLAIKKRGFHHTLTILLKAGAKIPRTKSIERYCVEQGFVRTAKIVGTFGDGSTDVDASMSSDCYRYCYERAKKQQTSEWDVQQFLEVALLKGLELKDVVSELLSEYRDDCQPTIDMLVSCCIPPKADSPETDQYLVLAKLVLDAAPELINANSLGNERYSGGGSALFMAARKGSLPHCQFFIERGAKVDQPNSKGCTPFWVACFMRYPCIITELIKHGAGEWALSGDDNWVDRRPHWLDCIAIRPGRLNS
jgi:ankyrin repeat protein